jgi:hypothetical protein
MVTLGSPAASDRHRRPRRARDEYRARGALGKRLGDARDNPILLSGPRTP